MFQPVNLNECPWPDKYGGKDLSSGADIRVPRPRLVLKSRRRVTPAILPTNEKDLGKYQLPNRDRDLDTFLRAVVDACVSNVAVLDEFGTLLYASKSWCRFEKANHLGSRQNGTFPDYFDDCKRFLDPVTGEQINASLTDDILQILVGDEKEFHRRYCYFGASAPLHFVTHAARLDLPDSGFRVLVTHDDVVVVQEALRESEERLSQLLETTKILAWEAELETLRFTYVSEHALEMLGYPIAHWYEPNFLASHIHRDDEKRALSIYQEHSQLPDQFDQTFRIVARDGRIVWLQNLVSVTRENGKPTKMRGFMIDISERKRTEEALQDLGGRLIAAQEEERRRLARELHDDLNQRMALLSIELEQLAQGIHKPPSVRGRLRKLQKQAQEISADIHRLSYKLHPSKLDHLGLSAAVKGLCQEISESQDIKIELKQTGFPADLPKDVTLCAFRIVQEALRNCVKHSGAQTVHVLLEKTADAVRLSVTDYGCGFDMESDVMKKGLGFMSMRERLHLLGGRFQIHSRPSQGTCIKVSIPLIFPSANS